MPLLQLALNGIALGAAYALVALGFVLVVNATGAVNFAHGDLVMAGGYAAVLLGAWLHAPLLVLLPLVAGVMFVLGVAVCFLAYFPLLDRPPSTVFISTLLCGIILENAYIVIFGPQAKAGPPLLAGGTIEIGTVLLSRQAVATIVVATVLVGVQYLVFFRTQIGRRLRAVSQDREMAQALGIRSLALIAITFGVGTALAGIAGAILANQFFVSPGGGVPLKRVRLHRRGDRRLGQRVRRGGRCADHRAVPDRGLRLRALRGRHGWPLCRVAGDAVPAPAGNLR